MSWILCVIFSYRKPVHITYNRLPHIQSTTCQPWCTAQGTNRSIRPVGVLSTAGSSIHIIMKSRTMFRVRSRSTILTTSTSPQSSVMHLMCGLLHRRSVLHNGFVLVVQCLLVRYYTDYLSVFNHTLIKSHCLID